MNPVGQGPSVFTREQTAPARAPGPYGSTGCSACKDPASYGAVSMTEDFGPLQSAAAGRPDASLSRSARPGPAGPSRGCCVCQPTAHRNVRKHHMREAHDCGRHSHPRGWCGRMSGTRTWKLDGFSCRRNGSGCTPGCCMPARRRQPRNRTGESPSRSTDRAAISACSGRCR